MVAYSFQKSFVPSIQSGSKRQTMRMNRKRHARPDELIQLYCGMRTKHCFKIISDPICSAVHPLRLEIERHSMSVEIAGFEIPADQLDQFALDDGFHGVGKTAPAEVMRRWWQLTHGLGVFPDLVLIQWMSE